MKNNVSALIFAVLAIIFAFVISKNVNLCGLIGGLWCYNPMMTIGRIAIITITVIAFILLYLLAIKLNRRNRK